MKKWRITVIVCLAGACLIVGCRQANEPSAVTNVASSQPQDDKTAPFPPNVPLKAQQLITAGIEQSGVTTSYDPSYVAIDYPGGDVPIETGVCSDVIVRAFRKTGIDLQKELHEDMRRAFAQYPKKWGLRRPDTNIDHRRVPNLMKWFERQNRAIAISDRRADYLPGDIVTWDLGNGIDHIGIVTHLRRGENYLIAHNIGAGTRLEDVLFNWKITGHYRYFR